jgi:hypothetical protein
MTQEEWQEQITEAQNNLNNIVKNARDEGNIVNLTVITDGPLSMVSLVSASLVVGYTGSIGYTGSQG